MDVDQTVRTDVGRVLRALEEVEAGLEALYSGYGKLFSEDRQAGSLFSLMSSEEKAHKNMIGFQQRLVYRERKNFDPVEVDFKGIQTTLSAIREAGNTEPDSLRQALIKSIEFEHSAAESYHRSVLVQSNPSVSGLLQTLTRENLRHRQRLVEFAVKRGWMEESALGKTREVQNALDS